MHPQPQTKSQYSANPDKIKYLTNQEVQSLLQAVKKESIRDYAIFLLSYYHGLRISEVGRLYYAPDDTSDYSEETKRITLHRMKGGLGFTYLVHEEAAGAIKKWLVIRGRTPGALFPSRKTKLGANKDYVIASLSFDNQLPNRQHGHKANLLKGISRRQLHTLFKYYAKKAKNPPIPVDKRHFHTLRHAIAVEMVEKGIPMVQIQDWLGHRSIASTVVYAKVSDLARNETARVLYGLESDEKKGKIGIDKGKGKGIDWKKDRRS